MPRKRRHADSQSSSPAKKELALPSKKLRRPASRISQLSTMSSTTDRSSVASSPPTTPPRPSSWQHKTDACVVPAITAFEAVRKMPTELRCLQMTGGFKANGLGIIADKGLVKLREKVSQESRSHRMSNRVKGKGKAINEKELRDRFGPAIPSPTRRVTRGEHKQLKKKEQRERFDKDKLDKSRRMSYRGQSVHEQANGGGVDWSATKTSEVGYVRTGLKLVTGDPQIYMAWIQKQLGAHYVPEPI
eukprot:g7950.t1